MTDDSWKTLTILYFTCSDDFDSEFFALCATNTTELFNKQNIPLFYKIVLELWKNYTGRLIQKKYYGIMKYLMVVLFILDIGQNVG